MSETTPSRAADPRPARTRATLFEALLELIQEKRWDKIRVQDVLDRTGLGRSTFYAHFDNKFDLLTAAIPSVTLAISLTDQEMPDLQPFFNHVQDMQPVLRPLMSQPLLGDIMDLFHRQLADAWRTHLDARGVDASRCDATANFLAGALLAVARDWVAHGCAQPSEQVCAHFSQLATLVVDHEVV